MKDVESMSPLNSPLMLKKYKLLIKEVTGQKPRKYFKIVGSQKLLRHYLPKEYKNSIESTPFEFNWNFSSGNEIFVIVVCSALWQKCLFLLCVKKNIWYIVESIYILW